MQSIYSRGIGDLNKYKYDEKIGDVYEIKKEQNRRNPQSIIDLANKIRTDGLYQIPSCDVKAPNMKNGDVKRGECLFIYTNKDGNVLPFVRKYLTAEKKWDFHDSKATKELNLTHNLIAGKAGFATLMEIYNKDPIFKYFTEGKFKRCVQSNFSEIDISCKTLDEIICMLKEKGIEEKAYMPTNTQKDYIDNNASLYERAKTYNYNTLLHTYVDNTQLINDKKQNEDEESKTGSKRSPIIKHLCKIEQAKRLFQEGEVSEFLKITGYSRDNRIRNIADKQKLKEAMSYLQDINDRTIQEVIELANEKRICMIDDNLLTYKEQCPYIYDRVNEVQYREFVNLYNYLEGQTPFSTQHKTKGSEFDNVLVILDNGKWNNYNFEKLFTSTFRNEDVVIRTEKIFYVCCTRAKEKLAVFYHKPTNDVINKAIEWFGEDNIINLDNKYLHE